ncbi:hypothetical protein [Chroococcidiopsis sp. CCMEE 29]|uniref:hypothetical protein n=1 Tax=Chroococcidiopsis sp. CCMEE 29 TaxID=155894 RepID=UPI0020217658|nr:hypothetical protein [Chroococcidiopsis sp. CCMEE 29]
MLTKKISDVLTALEKLTCVAAVQKIDNKVSGLIRLVATQLAVVGWLGMSLPSQAAIPTSYRNQYRVCAARLLRSGISSEAAATACAEALRPNDVARCVEQIERQTEIAAAEALATCREVRSPNDLARCVVGISRNTQEQPVPGILGYCGRSLLPVTFAECVVGLRREIEVAPNQAMVTCISASDRPREFAPSFIPQERLQQPPTSTPIPPVQTPPIEPSPAPTAPQQQTPPAQPTTPAVPTNPRGV